MKRGCFDQNFSNKFIYSYIFAVAASRSELKLTWTFAVMPQLFKSFKFGNGSIMSDENLVTLEFKYLQNKKWSKQAVKSTGIKKSYRTY